MYYQHIQSFSIYFSMKIFSIFYYLSNPRLIYFYFIYPSSARNFLVFFRTSWVHLLPPLTCFIFYYLNSDSYNRLINIIQHWTKSNTSLFKAQLKYRNPYAIMTHNLRKFAAFYRQLRIRSDPIKAFHVRCTQIASCGLLQLIPISKSKSKPSQFDISINFPGIQ